MTVLMDDRIIAVGVAADGTPDLIEVNYDVAIGYDWDEKGGIFCLADRDGKLISHVRVDATDEGLAKVIAMAEPHRRNGLLPPVILEDSRRPMATALAAHGFSVFVANSDALTHYRQMHGKLKKQKSDLHEGILLAQRFLNHPELHRNLAPVNPAAIEVTSLSRMESSLIRQLVDEANQLRSRLAEANPAVLQVWRAGQLTDGQTPCTWLKLVPTAKAGQALTHDQIEALLKDNGLGGGKRSSIARNLYDAYQTNYLTYDPDIDEAVGRIVQEQATGILELIERHQRIKNRLHELVSVSTFVELLADATGLGPKTLARLLGEIGDDPARFTNLRGFLAYAACVPYTEQSGSTQRNRRRRSRGNTLHATFWYWADAAKHHNPGARQLFWERRESGDFHATAIRKLMTKIARALWHCITTGEKWNDDRLWKPARPDLDEWAISVQDKITKTRKTPVTAR